MKCTNKFTHPSYQSSSFYINADVSSCGEYIASGSKTNDVYVWKRGMRDPFLLKGHRNSTTCVSWSLNEMELATGSDDMSIRIWKLDDRIPNPGEVPDPLLGFVEESERTPEPVIQLSQPPEENKENKGKSKSISMPTNKIQGSSSGNNQSTGVKRRPSTVKSITPAKKKGKQTPESSQDRRKSIRDFFLPINKND